MPDDFLIWVPVSHLIPQWTWACCQLSSNPKESPEEWSHAWMTDHQQQPQMFHNTHTQILFGLKAWRGWLWFQKASMANGVHRHTKCDTHSLDQCLLVMAQKHFIKVTKPWISQSSLDTHVLEIGTFLARAAKMAALESDSIQARLARFIASGPLFSFFLRNAPTNLFSDTIKNRTEANKHNMCCSSVLQEQRNKISLRSTINAT